MKELLQNSNIIYSNGSDSNSNIPVIDQQQQQRQPEQVAMTATGWCQSGGEAAAVAIGMVKVMTDEQMELLRKQICVYATLSERLVELHKVLTSQHPLSASGTRLSNPYCDPLLSSANNKIPARQRWTPTAMQLQILERKFKQCSTTPGRQKIKEIRFELAQHGQISEANVYNWFQNRRARSRRKQPSPVSKTGESGPQAKITSEEDKNMELEDDMHHDENLALIIGNMNFHGPEIGIDQLIGETKVPSSHWQVEQYGSSG